MRDLDPRLVTALYDDIVEGDALAPALESLAREFACESASIVSFDPLEPRAALSAVAGAFPEDAKRRYNADFAAHDPLPRINAGARNGAVMATDQFFSRDYLRRSLFLNEFLRPLGIEETLGGTLSTNDGRLAILTVHRGKRRAPFDDEDKETLGALLPHVRRALQLRRAIAQLDATARTLTDVVDRLSVGVVITDRDGATVHVNRAAYAIAARNDGLSLGRTGCLHARDRKAERLLVQARMLVAESGAGEVVRVPRSEDHEPYAVLVAPLPRGVTEAPDAAPGCLTLIHDPDVQFPDMAAEVARIFGMPAGAARLVAALAKGDDLKGYAERHALSYETVRYHVKTAFARTGTRSQSRLLQRVTRALTEFGTRK